MDWDDVEYLLEKTYLSTRSFSLTLLNKENALNLSTNGQLSKSSTECLHSQRKMLQLALDAYDTCKSEKERTMLAGIISQYEEEFALTLGKELKYPAVIGEKHAKRSVESSITPEVESFLKNLSIHFEESVDKESVDRTIETADSIFASIHESYLRSKNTSGDGDDDVVCLTQSVKETKLFPSKLVTSRDDHEPQPHQQQQQSNPFMTARQALNNSNNPNTRSNNNNYSSNNSSSYNGNGYNPAVQTRKILGAKRRCPLESTSAKSETANYRDDGRDINTEFSYYNMNKAPQSINNNAPNSNNSKHSISKPQQQQQPAQSNDEPMVDERLAGIEPRLIEMIRNEIMHKVDNITWESIAGLEHAKNSIKEIVVWPMLRPDLFTGLRGPPKGLLLFGPPGTGKTMIGKCIANQAKATFFSISASSLTSKWVGEGEKMVRALFAVARCNQPAVIFIDEIDSLLTQRTDGEFEASRRIKTEFLVQFDGAGTSSEDRILVIGATNRPQEIDEAARRRLVKRLYIPLPDSPARSTIIKELLKNQANSLSDQDIEWICERTDGYSGSDMHGLCKEAAMVPFRSITDILNISASQLRPICREDFEEALTQVRASVSNQDLEGYLDWNKQFGSLSSSKN